MRFANPDAFTLLWIIPMVIVVSLFLERRAKRRFEKFFGEKVAPYLRSGVSGAKRKLKLLLRCLALSMFIVALARPQMGKSQQEVKSVGVEMMIAFDVSTSMLSEDVKPSRLQHAKSEINRLLDLLSGDKVGLVAFAGSAVLVSPLTTDKSALKMFVDSLSPDSVGSQGTNIQKALDESRKAFERGGVETNDEVRATRVILVASDGEDHEKGALEEAKKLVADGTRIFSLAFGSERGGPIPLRDERGYLRGYKRDRGGQNVMSTVKGDFLRELAKVGKGSFHYASFGGQEAKAVKADLDKLEKAEFASAMAVQYDERFQVPLFIGLLLALAELLLGERKRAGRLWRGRFEVAES